MPKIAIIQMRASTDKSKNLKKILDYIGKAAKQGAALCTFPEFMMFYTKASQPPEQLANIIKNFF
jgi:predicted amidohydrolase